MTFCRGGKQLDVMSVVVSESARESEVLYIDIKFIPPINNWNHLPIPSFTKSQCSHMNVTKQTLFANFIFTFC